MKGYYLFFNITCHTLKKNQLQIFLWDYILQIGACLENNLKLVLTYNVNSKFLLMNGMIFAQASILFQSHKLCCLILQDTMVLLKSVGELNTFLQKLELYIDSIQIYESTTLVNNFFSPHLLSTVSVPSALLGTEDA